jgi:crotonobetainyl-CoA:carnitine CoA-transferase CaiB-like acyl-CoA transferase
VAVSAAADSVASAWRPRVLELGQSAGSAFCGKLLAEMGLEVVMVEPKAGHPLRSAAPQAALADGATVSALWLYLAGGKRSIMFDAQDAAARTAQDELIAASDLVIHDLPEHAACDAGLTFERLRRLRPGIVVAAITPFGSTGPYAGLPSSDLTVYALAGHLHLTGSPDREPLLPYGRQPALFGGVLGATAALAGLLRSRLDGIARSIEVSQQEALAGALDTTVNGYTYTGAMRSRHGNRIQESSPLTDVYRTQDGFFLICVYTEPQWRGFCAMLERSDWLEDPDFATLTGRVAKGAAIEAAMVAWFATRTSRAALAECQRHRLPSCLVSDVPQLLCDAQLIARDHFAPVEAGRAGTLAYPKLPFVMSSGASTEDVAPDFDEDRETIGRSWKCRAASSAAIPGNASAPPLAGIRILDVTHAWAGPFGALQLGYLGADMIKIEGARRPDGTRYVSRDERNLSPAYESGGYFHEWNRNKRSAVINMDDADGRALMHELIRKSDVLINNYSARVLPKWGLDWPAVHALNPRLVLVTMPAFGSQGPYREFVGYGETLEGAGGLVRLSGYEPGKPIRSGVAYPDPLVGHYGALAAVLGLQQRAATGEGIWLDLSHQECVLHMIGDAVLHYQLAHRAQEPSGNARADLLLNAVLPCAGDDNWVAVTAETSAQLSALAALTGIEVLAQRGASEAALAALCAWSRTRDKREVMQRCLAEGVAAGAVLKVDELLDDPHLAARRFFERVRHPVVGDKPHPGAGFRIAGVATGSYLAAPLFDAHTDEILSTVLGLAPGEIASLRQRGTIGGMPAGSQVTT